MREAVAALHLHALQRRGPPKRSFTIDTPTTSYLAHLCEELWQAVIRLFHVVQLLADAVPTGFRAGGQLAGGCMANRACIVA